MGALDTKRTNSQSPNCEHMESTKKSSMEYGKGHLGLQPFIIKDYSTARGEMYDRGIKFG